MRKILIVFIVLAQILLFATNNNDMIAGEIANEQELCSDAEVKIGLGKNSPNSETILISNPQTDLVIGQLELAGTGENCYLNLDSIKLKINYDYNISLTNIKMYKDNNGNGVVDAEDNLLSTVESTSSGYASFSSSNPENRIWNNKKNNILFTLDAKYKEDATIQNSAKFVASIEDGGIVVSDGGTPAVKGLPVEFSTFQFEPPTGDYFIVTTGAHDPAVTAISEMNNNIPVMQIRTKSIGKANSITKFKIKIPNNAVKFGEKNGITGISLWLDTDNDGIGDIKIAEKTSFESGETTSIEFEEFSQPLSYISDEEKYIVVKVDFNMIEADPAMFGKIIILNGGIRLEDTDATIIGLPINSKPYEYSCDPNFEECSSSGNGSKEAESENDSDKEENNNDSENKQGELYGECYPNNTCNNSLVCNTTNNICLKEEPKSSSGCSVLVF